MSHLITVCDGCHSVALAAVPELRGQPRACESCGHPTRVMPSRMFQDAERPLFEELSASAAQGGLSSMEAHALHRRITRALAQGGYTSCWEELTNRLPALLSRQLVLGNNFRAHEKALQILRAILEALATTRRSGTMPAVQLEVHRKQAT